MKKKQKKITIISLIAVLLISISIIVTISSFNKKTPLYDIDENKVNEAYEFLKTSRNETKKTYYDFKLENSNKNTIKNVSAKATMDKYNLESDNYNYSSFNNNATLLGSIEYGQEIEYSVNIAHSGLYEINVDYLIKGDNILNAPIVSFKINDNYQYEEAKNIVLPLIWEGTEGKEFPLDSYGDETIPLNYRDDTTWQRLEAYDSTYCQSSPLQFYFESGINKITITYQTGSSKIIFGDLFVNSITSYLSYKDYISLHANEITVSGIEAYNAVYYNSKNSSYICLANEKSPTVEPFSTKKNYINTIGVDSWDDAGQSITYKINASQTGLYNLAFHYQNDKNEYDSFRSIYIDGKIPFLECKDYAFPVTSSNSWKNETLNIDGNNMYFYLTKGEHYVTLKAENNNVYSLTSKIQAVIDHINYFALEILKVTGNEIDKDRTWHLTENIPNTVQYLSSYDFILKSIMNEGSAYSTKGIDSATLSYVKKAIVTLKKLMKKPNELPLYLANLYSGSSSINQLLGSSITTINEQPLGLDMIYLYNNKKLPSANANAFKKIGSSVSKIFNSYTSKKYDTQIDDSVLNVWVNKPLTYINILQQMVDRDFNSTSKRKVKISMMPDANKLLLSTAAGESPDVALGLASYTPFDFAIRNAAYDLSSFSDFYEVANRFPAGTLVPFVLNDKFYAFPESIDFQVTLYREDIFNSFNIKVPDTWDDLIDILHTLQQYNMNYYLPISAQNSTKWFYQTVPMIYQYGGTLYTEDGLKTTIDSEEALKGLTLLTDFFKYYSLDSQVISFYNSFRYGTHPIGTATFSEYLLVKNAAPEINGKWKISSPLGVKREDNSINRTYVSSGTSAMIFKNTNKANEAWEFLKWWTSTPIQIEYSNRLQSTYGPEYTWLSSNVEAIKQAPIDNNDKEVIVDSLEWIIDVPRTPGQYMLERGLSNIWTKVAIENRPIGLSIDNEVVEINREITKKMKEFHYLDSNGNVIKEYKIREKDWIEQIIKAHTGGVSL